jgi:CDP-glucose 4,6-dehydratase
MGELSDFWKEKKVFITGHTGFKGSWLSLILLKHGAKVKGYSKDGFEKGSFYDSLKLCDDIESIKGDITDYSSLEREVSIFSPDIIFHLAAQPLVLESYSDPRGTFSTNVMGTLNVLEVSRSVESVKSIISVTTDKVYKNNEWDYSYREIDSLGGYDPYSASKASADILTNSYKQSFFNEREVGICAVRAGNVIGGGDFSENRLIPDIVRSVNLKHCLDVRYPFAIRPWQHVIEPLKAYMEIAKKQYANPDFGSAYNVGPDSENACKVEYILNFSEKFWEGEFKWQRVSSVKMHEAGLLKLDSSLVRAKTNWKPTLTIDETLERTLNWYKKQMQGCDTRCLCESDIEYFFNA